MFAYSSILIIFFLLYFISFLSEKLIRSKNQLLSNYFIYFFVFIVFCFSAFRFGVGWDYYQYYWTIVSKVDTNIMGKGELATIALINLSSDLGLTNLYFFINSFITIFLISITINKYSVNKWASIFIFLCFPLFFLNSLSVIRFFTALSITFYAFKYIKSQEMLKFLFLVYIASMFHSSALIAIVLYVFSRLSLNFLKVIILCVLAIIASTLLNVIVVKYFPVYAVYTEETIVQEGTLAIYFFAMLLVACLPVINSINKDKVAKLYFNCFFFGFLIYISFYGQGSMSHRLSLYGTIFSLLLIPKVLRIIFKKNIVYVCAYFVFYIVFMFLFLYYINVGSETYLPYRTIFDN